MNKKSNMPFGDESSASTPLNSGLKLNSKKSRFSQEREKLKEQELNFGESVSSHQEKQNSMRARAADLSTAFINIVKDRTIIQNRGPLVEDLEKDVISSLIQLALELNNTESEPEGAGSVGLELLLMKAILIQRNAINQLSYELNQLKEKGKSSGDM